MTARSPHEPACPLTDAIIARHLDGDVAAAAELAEGAGWQPGDFLADHLADCAICNRELRRSRRLDAALAEASGRASGDLDGDAAGWRQLLDRAIAMATEPAPPPPAAPRGRPLAHRIAVASGLLAMGFVLAWWLLPRAGVPSACPPDPASINPVGPAAVLAPAAPIAIAPTDTPPAPSIGIRLASTIATPPPLLPTLGVPRTRAEVQQLVDLLADRALGDRMALQNALPFALCGARGTADVATAAADALRLRANAWLLDAPAAFAFEAWARAIAGLDGGPVLDGALAEARRRPTLAAKLAARLLAIATTRHRSLELDSLAMLTAAARIGGRDLDRALRQLLRRVDVHGELAAALRRPSVRDGRTALLLDVWGDLCARGHGDDEGLARALFAGQPTSVGRDLAIELQRSRQTPRRLRCLLALGVLAPAEARELLVAALRSPVMPEALAAGFALAQLPRQQLRDLLPVVSRGEPAWLLRAALCCAGVPEACDWLAELELTPAERELLRTGNCTLAQFPVFAGLLRDRSPSTF